MSASGVGVGRWSVWALAAAVSLTGCQKKAADSTETGEAFQGDPAMVVGSFGQETVTLADVNKIVEVWKANQMPGIAETSARELQKRALESLLEQKVLFSASKDAGMVPSTEQVDQVMQQLQARYPNQQDFENALTAQHITLAELRQNVITEVAIRQYLAKTIPDTLRITPADCRGFYDQHPELFEQLHARHILIRVEPGAAPEVKDRARQRADSLLSALRAGGDFEEAARKASQDPYSAPRGGDLGFFGRGQMVPPFEEAAYKLAPGQVSDIVETQYGFHIIRLEEKKQVPYDANIEGALTQNLLNQRRAEVVRQHIEGLKSQLSIDRKL